MERDINKVTTQRRGIKRKNSGKLERFFITNIVSKAYEILKKTQNEAIQSNITNMQTAGKKNRSTMDNIIVIDAIIEKQNKVTKTHTIFFLMQENALTNYG